MATKAKYKCDHEENRCKVCAVCGKKIVFGRNPRSKFIISKDMEGLIKMFSNDAFDLLDSRFPRTICTSCKLAMYERNRGKVSRFIPQMPNFLDIQLLKETRSRDNHECNCYICQTARQKGHTKIDTGKGVKKDLNLKTGGRNARVILNPKTNKPIFFSEENLDNLVANTGISLNQMEKVTNFIRTTAGKKSVPPYYRNHASKKARVLEEVYECGKYDFDVEKLPEKEKRPVVYADAGNLLDYVLDARNQYGEMVIKLMADGGKGFFKISMTVLPKDYSQEAYDSDCEESPPKKKRKTYKEGGTLGKKANLNGVNRLIMICAVPNIKETYDNVKLLWNLTKLNNIPYKFVSDYKLLLIIIGQQTASSTYPCPFCFITLDVLRTGEVGMKMPCNEVEDVDVQISEQCLKLKTFGDIKESYNKFVSLKCDKKIAKNCHSVVNLPLFDEPDEMPVIEKVIIPELHEIQGIVNHNFFDGLVPLLGRENAMKWPKKPNLISKNYHGEKFEGNACRRLLKMLNDKVLQNTPIIKVIPFIQTLKTLNKLVDATFKSKGLGEKWPEYVEELKQHFPATGLSNTLKVHVLLEHLQQGLHFLNGDSLGLWSEQAGESVHREFLKYWENTKIITSSLKIIVIS